MNNEGITAYGWEAAAPQSCGYIAPTILQIVRSLGVHRILDLGCGNGELCGQLSRAGYEVAGAELDAGGVRLARQANPNIPFYNCGVHEDPQLLLAQEGGRAFDAVISTEVIEHLYAPQLLPAFARQVLVNNGYLILSTPYHGYLKNLMLSVTDHWDRHHTALWHGGHIKFWSRATLTELLEDGHFRVTDFRGVGRFAYLWKSMVITARKTS